METTIRWLSLAAWLIWLIVYWRGGVGLASSLARAFRTPASRRDALLILGIIVLSNVMLWTGYLIARGRIEEQLLPCPEWLPKVGSVLIAIGAIGTLYCRRQLGGSWSAQSTLLADHKLVDSGAYRVVRHPIYGFASTMSVGTIMVFPTWWNVAAGILMACLYVIKGLVEEKLLADKLPGYREYQQRVRYRIAPWIW